MASVDQRIDRLYALPLAEFTAARNALARELKGTDRAEDVRRLAKPTAPVWAINQAVRADKAAAAALLEAADALRKAQERALGRSGGGAALREAQEREREAVQRVAHAAAQALGGASSAQRERIEQTLSAAALDPEARGLLKAGRLTEELEPAGFGALAGMKLPPPPKPRATPRPKAKPRPDPRAARRRELEQELRAAEREVERLRRALERLST